MADFTSATTRRDRLAQANQILNTYQVIYGQCLAVQAILAKYNNDADFRAEANYLFTPEQIAELGVMATQVNSLQLDWFQNHKGPLGL